MSNLIIELNEGNFAQEVLGEKRPVLVQFWAGWSEPCKSMTSFLESLAEDECSAVKVCRVNVEQHEDLAEEYGVRCVPTMLIFNQGGLKDQVIGRTTENEVREKLDRLRIIPQDSQLAASAKNMNPLRLRHTN